MGISNSLLATNLNFTESFSLHISSVVIFFVQKNLVKIQGKICHPSLFALISHRKFNFIPSQDFCIIYGYMTIESYCYMAIEMAYMDVFAVNNKNVPIW